MPSSRELAEVIRKNHEKGKDREQIFNILCRHLDYKELPTARILKGFRRLRSGKYELDGSGNKFEFLKVLIDYFQTVFTTICLLKLRTCSRRWRRWFVALHQEN
jgi:hypothetical protein